MKLCQMHGSCNDHLQYFAFEFKWVVLELIFDFFMCIVNCYFINTHLWCAVYMDPFSINIVLGQVSLASFAIKMIHRAWKDWMGIFKTTANSTQNYHLYLPNQEYLETHMERIQVFLYAQNREQVPWPLTAVIPEVQAFGVVLHFQHNTFLVPLKKNAGSGSLVHVKHHCGIAKWLPSKEGLFYMLIFHSMLMICNHGK